MENIKSKIKEVISNQPMETVINNEFTYAFSEEQLIELVDIVVKEISPSIEEVEDIEFNSIAEGCGLEDVGITDRYEAMEYGFKRALLIVIDLYK